LKRIKASQKAEFLANGRELIDGHVNPGWSCDDIVSKAAKKIFPSFSDE
jgi:hypothetical protein